ncbi:OpgC domain-containing protein [Bradyrhizobium jicamae]|uniref:OpgC domain-containing protein n=1 Tax=Bradyrhizobium jicamae TaxID=280332 RepID=A0ABS5FKT0_9BRAD|nr:OpgC domain-containing protein [Bradyrhizobium jicamae]MBR0797366.1 OpgC domain-containing protein [Bradyrhizobium jicamae]MBR0936206.1 OpgC domain-containing protein [Bradyrhizobium jicamae]
MTSSEDTSGTKWAALGPDASSLTSASKPAFAIAEGQRELRLDLFRGLALWLIYIDHVSPDRLTWFTVRNYGFSDAAEIFIYISGFTAALVYGRATFETGFVIGTARVLRRVWQIYTAHLLLFLVLMAEIAYVVAISDKPAFYIGEMEVADFFKEPGPVMIQTLLLRFRPLNMDVLPLYIVLMAFLPLVFLLARLHRDLPLFASIVLYVLTIRYDLHLTTYRDGFWSFNPCGWQLLFVFGAWCALGGGRRLSPILDSPLVFWLAVTYLCAAFFVTLTWYIPALESFIPGWLARLIYPINKTDFDILRFAHFLSLAVVALRFVPGGWRGLKSPLARPLILCGQYSLQIFALGVALSFAGYAILTELDAGLVLHVIVGIGGILVMCGAARIFTWYKRSTTVRERAKPVVFDLTVQTR